MAAGIPGLGSLADYASYGSGLPAELSSMLGLSDLAGFGGELMGGLTSLLGGPLGMAIGPIITGIQDLITDPNRALPDLILGPLAMIPGLEKSLQDALGLGGLPREAKTSTIAQELSQSGDPGDQLLGKFITQGLGGGQVLSSKGLAGAAPMFADLIEKLTGTTLKGQGPSSAPGISQINVPSPFGQPIDVWGVGGQPFQQIGYTGPKLSMDQVAQLYPQLAKIAMQFGQTAQGGPGYPNAIRVLNQQLQQLMPQITQLGKQGGGTTGPGPGQPQPGGGTPPGQPPPGQPPQQGKTPSGEPCNCPPSAPGSPTQPQQPQQQQPQKQQPQQGGVPGGSPHFMMGWQTPGVPGIALPSLPQVGMQIGLPGLPGQTAAPATLGQPVPQGGAPTPSAGSSGMGSLAQLLASAMLSNAFSGGGQGAPSQASQGSQLNIGDIAKQLGNLDFSFLG